jgi:hypothetical protein
LLFFIATSCTSDNSENNSLISHENLIDSFTNHEFFRISTFIEESNDKTDFFGQYTFSFSSNNVVTAELNSEITTGFYDIFVDDGRIELRLLFPGNPQLNELNDDWYFISQTENTIKFNDSGDIIEFIKL